MRHLWPQSHCTHCEIIISYKYLPIKCRLFLFPNQICQARKLVSLVSFFPCLSVTSRNLSLLCHVPHHKSSSCILHAHEPNIIHMTPFFLDRWMVAPIPNSVVCSLSTHTYLLRNIRSHLSNTCLLANLSKHGYDSCKIHYKAF